MRPILHLRVNDSVGSQVWRAGELRGQARRRRPEPLVEGEEARQKRDHNLGDVAPEFVREELHDFPGLLCSLCWSRGGQRLRHLLGSCRCGCHCCCCYAGLSVEEREPWSPRGSKGIRQDSEQVPWMVSVQSLFQQEQLEPESSWGLAVWKRPPKGQGFLLRLVKAYWPTRSDPRSLKVPQGQPRLSHARSCTPASTPLWVCLSYHCLYPCA